jgi:anaerobic selenocysteine-containing dehydrogenase
MLKAKITRRDFLKGSVALTGAATALSFLQLSSKKVNATELYTPEWNIEWKPNVCGFCANICGLNVRVHKKNEKERPLKIEGNEWDNYGQGKICARGQSGLKYLFNPDRITTPLIRRKGSKRGEWNFRKATWEEAFQYIMEKVQKHNIQPHEWVFLGGWHGCAQYRPWTFGAALLMEMLNIWGAPIQNCVGIEHLGIHVATGYFNAHDEMVVDFENANFILVVRSNGSLAGISTGRAHRFGEAIKRGAMVAVVDVRRSETASRADIFLKIKPGTDLAFALAMLHVILHEKYYGKSLYEHNLDFIKYHTNAPHLVIKKKHPVTKQETWWLLSDKDGIWWKNFHVWDKWENRLATLQGYLNHNKTDIDGKPVDPALELDENVRKQLLEDLKKKDPSIEDVKTAWELLKEKTKSYTPEWAEKITEIPAHKIREVAILFATKRPSVIEPGIYDARYANSIQLRKVLTQIQMIVNGHDNIGGWIVGGEYRHKVAKFWEWLNKEGFNWIGGKYVKFPIGYPVEKSPYPTYNMPGVFWVLDAFFGLFLPNAQNPEAIKKFVTKGDYTELVKSATSSGVPNIAVLASFEQWAKFMSGQSKEPGIALPVVSDYGFDRAFEGKLQWNGKPYKPKAIFGYAINPVLGNPYGDKWKKWMEEAKLVVFLDTMPTDSNVYADVILPDEHYLERDDIILGRGNSHHLTVFKRSRVAKIGEGKHGVDFFFEMTTGMLASRLMQEGKAKNMQEAMAKAAKIYCDFVSKMLGYNTEEFWKEVQKTVFKERKPFTKAIYNYQLKELAKEVSEAKGKEVKPEELDKELKEKGFYDIETMEELLTKWRIPEQIPTTLPSGRIELYSTLFEMVQAFYGYMPNWDPVCEYIPLRRKENNLEPDEFFISHGKAPVFSHSGVHTLDNPLIVGITKWKKLKKIYYHVWIHPKAAQRLGIKDGDLIEVVNTEDPSKKMKARAFVTEWVREDTIFVPFNGGTEAPVQFAVKPPEAARHVDVVTYKVEPVISGYTRDEVTVRVRKVSA